MPVMTVLDALETLEKEKVELYSLLQQKRQQIQYLNATLTKEQARYDNLIHLIKSVQTFNTGMVKHLRAKFKEVQSDGTAYSWETTVNPVPYFQATLDIWDPNKVDGVSYLAFMDIEGQLFDIFVEEPTEGENKYQIKLVPCKTKSTMQQHSAPDTWEQTIFNYVNKQLPQDVCKSFHNIEDLVAWCRAIHHPEIRITHESYLGLPCVDTFSGLRITCDGRVNIASE